MDVLSCRVFVFLLLSLFCLCGHVCGVGRGFVLVGVLLKSFTSILFRISIVYCWWRRELMVNSLSKLKYESDRVVTLLQCLLSVGLWTCLCLVLLLKIMRFWIGVLTFGLNYIFACMPFYMLSLPHQLQVQVIKKSEKKKKSRLHKMSDNRTSYINA